MLFVPMRRLTTAHVRQGAASVADQVLLSGTNFVIGVVLATQTDPETYGSYALAFAVLLTLQGLQGALLTTPLTILSAPRGGDDLRELVAAMGAAQVAFGAAASAACALASAIWAVLAPGSAFPPALLGLGVACIFVQGQQFVRRLLYARLQAGRALASDAVFCALQLGGLAALLLLDRADGGGGSGALGGRNVFIVMGAAAAAGIATGLALLRGLLLPWREVRVRQRLAEAWAIGRFGIGEQFGHAMFLLANRVAAAVAGGPAGVAMLEAPRLLVAPLQIVGASAGNLTTPRAARAFARGGRDALLRFLAPVAAAWAIAFAGYAAIVAAAPGFWLRLVYGGKYAGAETVLVLWCATYALLGVRVVPASALRVTRNNAPLMWATVAAGATVLAATAVLAAWLGVTGAAIGRLVGEVTLVVLVALTFLRRVAARERAS